MSLLEVSNLTFSYADERLYQDASMRLFEGEHAVLVGPNGAGKSTLMKLLSKQISPDKGTIEWVNYRKVGYLDQYANIDPRILVKEYLYDVFLPLFEKEQTIQKLYESIAELDPSEYDKILNRAHALEEELEKADFYAISSKISSVMNGLGLDTNLLESKISILSGGMRAKLILAKLLLENTDILLLDEPTNFLDIKHIEWLIKFLNGLTKTFIVVSHDEYFLKSIATTVFALENKQINRYRGDYDYYLKERELRFDQQSKAFASQQKFIQKTEDYIAKNIVRASTTKMAQSRRKMLEKIVRIEKPKTAKAIKIKFLMDVPTGRDVLKVKKLSMGYDRPLVEPLDFIVKKGEKVAITGKNGIGKSTLIKTLNSVINPLEGSFEWIDTANILYFEQDINLEEKYTPFEMIHAEHSDYDRKQIYSILASFGIDFEKAMRPISTLSGGEKTKVKLAISRNIKSNVLILDEPTNHLDVMAKEALMDALIEYPGTVILVSHEKKFYSEICDYEIHLENT